MADRICLFLIRELYQRRISPHKGYGCSKRILDEKTGSSDPHSCSAHAVLLIKELGVWGAIGPMRTRFRECRAAAVQLHAMHADLVQAAHSAMDAVIAAGNNVDPDCGNRCASGCENGLERLYPHSFPGFNPYECCGHYLNVKGDDVMLASCCYAPLGLAAGAVALLFAKTIGACK